jgi:cytochrome c oxidase subunit 2
MRRQNELPADAAQRSGRRWIVGGGIVLPLLAIVALLVFGAPAGRHHLPWPGADGSPPLRIDVIGRQWQWELHYPDSGVRLRNELRLPVGRPVHVHTQSRDVIHSFWVPSLGGKLDALPGRTLVMRLQADRPGSWRGQCAEFCGLGHAHMSMTVLAMEPAAFDAWLAAQGPAQEETR